MRSGLTKRSRMRRPMSMVAMTAALMATGCSKSDDAGSATAMANYTPPAVRAPTPVAGQAQTTPITAYVGKYPHDAVGGVDFFDRTDVANALIDIGAEDRVRALVRGRSGPQTPIFQRGTQVASWGCEAHNCSDHNWMLSVEPKTGAAELCYHDADTMRDQSRWYTKGAAALRPGACPSEG